MSSLGIEVLEAVPKPDVVVVCCGGGGLLAGVAAAIKLSGCNETRIYGVEPEGGKWQHGNITKNGRGSNGSHRFDCQGNIGLVLLLSFFLFVKPSVYNVPKLH